MITTIGVGGRRAWEQDVFIPRKYGIYMPVGRHRGPAGTSRALRMIPAMVAIARDVLDLCPHALFFNYANPMATSLPRGAQSHRRSDGRALHRHVGHGPLPGRTLWVPAAELSYTVAGINHLTWFTDVRVGGEDAMPRMHQTRHGILRAAGAKLTAAYKAGRPMPKQGGSPFGSSLDFPSAWQCL